MGFRAIAIAISVILISGCIGTKIRHTSTLLQHSNEILISGVGDVVLQISKKKSLPNAFEQFINGKLAYFFGYNYHADELRRRGVQFDWGLVNFPQTRGSEGTKYYAHYWVNVVAKKSKNTQVAWSFIDATANQKVVEKYLNINKKPTALKGLIDKQLQDDDIYIFTSQVLTADNWYKGYDIKTAEKYTADLINDILSGEISLNNDIKVLEEILNVFFQRINNTYNNKYE